MMKTLCINWPNIWIINKKDRDVLLKRFLDTIPILPDVYEKFSNTLAFYDSIIKPQNNTQLSDEVVVTKTEVD